MKSKPIQVYLSEEELKELETVQEAMGIKTRSKMIKSLISLAYRLLKIFHNNLKP